ncbi:hypothetical protein SAMN02745245_01963 [Anaerosphaera aminiphila DSM 21120]|uniref:ABC-2 family transporter protein n=1 Tax=Anaerosphaera aminiphila DSM 21120 TaxID=1120995 RepID=A0A1M5V3L9_9FIRM|nr:hypothetical protein [Anaerosphaera aminiphila]SHH69698.1 hypothetical protein SAMN02745245_01963 [Anaerosphaera aminiphila DSM 21120]
MGIMMMKQSIKKALTPSSLFMGIIALVIIVYTNMIQEATNELMGYSIFEFFLKGIVFLFIMFSNELSKDTLQEEKRTKRIEWYLANDLKISIIMFSHSFATFIATNILIVPIILITSFVMKEFSIFGFVEYLFNTFLYSLMLNIMILRTVNMNRFKNIWKKIVVINFLLLILDFLLEIILPGVIISSTKIIILSMGCFLLYRFTNKEMIVSAYY